MIERTRETGEADRTGAGGSAGRRVGVGAINSFAPVIGLTFGFARANGLAGDGATKSGGADVSGSRAQIGRTVAPASPIAVNAVCEADDALSALDWVVDCD